jgi:hypothetical protein
MSRYTRELAESIYFDDDGTGSTSIERIESKLRFALAQVRRSCADRFESEWWDVPFGEMPRARADADPDTLVIVDRYRAIIEGAREIEA